MATYAHWLVMIGGAILLAVSIGIVRGAGPDWLKDWVPLVTSTSGILLGAGLGVMIYLSIDRRERLRVTGLALLGGIVFIALATVPILGFLEIEQWRDAYVAGFGAVCGATLSVILSHLQGQ